MNGQPVPSRLQYLVEKDLGHKGKKSYCYGCGELLKGGWEQYNIVLEWFKSQKDINQYILRSGNRQQDERWWFLTDFPNDKYEPLLKIGFQVRQNDDGKRFVSEPFGTMEDPPKYCVNPDCKTNQRQA